MLLGAHSWRPPTARRRGAPQEWYVNHFFAGHKPWRTKTRCAMYFEFMRAADFTPPSSNRTKPCMRALWERHDCLQPGLTVKGNATLCHYCRVNGQKSTCYQPPGCAPESRWPVWCAA